MKAVSSTSARQPPGGFTLIEVVCALALTIFLFGGIYGIAHAALTLSRSSNQARTAELRLNNLDTLLRTAFEAVPPAATFELTFESASNGSSLTFRRAPGILCWNGRLAAAGMEVLRTEPDPRRKGASRLVIQHWRESAQGQHQPMGQLKILEGLDFARWRLLDPQTNRWETLWVPSQGRPRLAELTFLLAGSAEEQRMVFWIPEYVPRQRAAPAQSPRSSRR